jgi:O-antigen/teichoic acid export membrane protein
MAISSGGKITQNTILNLLGQGSPMLVAFFSIPLLIKGMGVDRFGVLTLAWMIIGYFSLFDLGLGRALTQIVAHRISRQGEAEIAGLVWTALYIMIVAGFAGGLLAGFISPFLVTKVFKMPEYLRSETLYAFYILAAFIPVVILSSGFVGILTAYQRFDLINAVRFPLGLANYALH